MLFKSCSLQPTYFEAAIGVNATSLVTLTTLFTSVADSLPRTAYLKLIDIWYHMRLLGYFKKKLKSFFLL